MIDTVGLRLCWS